MCLFRSLADPTRLAMCSHMALGEHKVVELTAHLGLAQCTDQVHLHFTELCEAPTSTGDLLELADRYRTVVLADVPALVAATEDGRRRFGNLIDICWDRDVRLLILSKLKAGARWTRL